MPKPEQTLEERINEVYDNLKEAQIKLQQAKINEDNAKLLKQKAHKEFILAKDAQWALEREQS